MAAYVRIILNPHFSDRGVIQHWSMVKSKCQWSIVNGQLCIANATWI
ncbi:hypothetical protein H6G89_19690 [Oscillatoria sp. FACHB-1407]|nr:hypothetical protein [Oscillatoria sp. FACHB-1407]MBD2463261.1 hypothetical protein [Oscillatoria sp. FACHB-1407]